MSAKPNKTAEVIGPDHAISKMARGLSRNVDELAAKAGISPWDVCVALANACGQILAQSKDMPRDHALDRMDSLREIAQGAYDLYDVKGEA